MPAKPPAWVQFSISEHCFGRVTARSVGVYNRQRLEPQSVGAVVFADLHITATPLAPFRKFSAIYTVAAIHAAGRILVGRINMPMRFYIGSMVPSALNYLPMPDAIHLTCQT
jgi:hypothetical protein